MLQLIYTSTATVDFTGPDLKKLLVAARLKNAADGVSGMLLHHDGKFLQMLEGEPAAVATVYGRIEKDPRHHDIRVLARRAALGRRFEAWSMGFSDAADNAAILRGYVRVDAGLDLQSLTGDDALRLLEAYGAQKQPLSAAS
jgi:hypothetical protein